MYNVGRKKNDSEKCKRFTRCSYNERALGVIIEPIFFYMKLIVLQKFLYAYASVCNKWLFNQEVLNCPPDGEVVNR